jgi:hypothetical protein
MKTFREFILEISAADIPKNAPASGGGTSTVDIDARTDLTPEQKAKYAKFRGRSKRVPSENIRGTNPSSASGKPPTGTPPKSSAIVKSGPSALSTNVKPPVQKVKTNLNVPGGNKIKGLKGGSVLSGVIDTAAEKSSGSGWARSLAKGTTSALGALVGGAAGSAAGPVGTVVGGAAGSMAAGKAFDTVAGANAVGRKQIATANRKSQSGGGLVGTGGKTTFDTKKNTITSGGKTAQLGKTSVVTDPKTGKQGVGYLAYKGGKAVYKRPDTKSLAQTSSNPWERIGRTIAPGAYKANDAKLAAAKLKTAATSDIKRQQSLGVKGSKNLVGPKIVGPKIVGPAKPAGTTGGTPTNRRGGK